ncbi:hypothetical protein HK097_010363 [Rhizophlyctis rosea]|uniref:SET domain-containing protein n=1 Tax=Rhizophlyctis rosea TaxID=64517 RepID=A0AAD5SAY2_9FUNG|nr:hypothetical protein HK097_010363 [Rhizophlyctis rosea]
MTANPCFDSYTAKNAYPISLKYSPEAGRYAVASRPIPTGDTVLKCLPFGVSLNHNCRRQACHTCGAYTLARSSLPLSCTTCKSVYYCSQSCKSKRSQYHQKYECPSFRDIHALSGPKFKRCFEDARKRLPESERYLADVYTYEDIQDNARWALGIMVRKQVEEDSLLHQSPTSFTHTFPTFADVLDLVGNESQIPSDERHQLHFIHEILSTLPSSSKKSTTPHHQQQQPHPHPTFSTFYKTHFLTPETFTSLLCIRQMNGFGLWDGANECLGHALYAFASYFNHSCAPNMVRDTGLRCADNMSNGHADENGSETITNSLANSSISDDCAPLTLEEITQVLLSEPSVSFRALHPITKDSGLHHSYIECTMSRKERLRILKEGYCFDCGCPRCVDVDRVDGEVDGVDSYVEKYVCGSCGAVRIPGEVCVRCGGVV